MTKEEALKMLGSNDIKDLLSEQYQEAFKMAKAALSREYALDKIEIEVKQLPSELTADGRRMIRRSSVISIIDKYRSNIVKHTGGE